MRLGLVVIVLAAALAAPSAASACSIAAQPPEERLADADVAVFGKVVSKRLVSENSSSPGDRYRYRFRVREVYKGHVRRRITLRAYTDSGTCGVELHVGDRFGLLLDGRRGPWDVGTGSFMPRRELRSLRSPRAPGG